MTVTREQALEALESLRDHAKLDQSMPTSFERVRSFIEQSGDDAEAEVTRTLIAGLGHGHVVPRSDGVKARCGGPPFCKTCALEAAAIQSHSGSSQ